MEKVESHEDMVKRIALEEMQDLSISPSCDSLSDYVARCSARIDAERGKDASFYIESRDVDRVLRSGFVHAELTRSNNSASKVGVFLSPTIPAGMALTDSKPIAWLRFWAGRMANPSGDIDYDEGLEVCREGENGAARQASLCDMISQIGKELPELRARLEKAKKDAERYRLAIEEYLVNNDPSEFGCACDPSVDYLCGPCHAHKQQEPLRLALALIDAARAEAGKGDVE